MSDDEPVISHRIQGVTFSLFTSKEIRKLSVKEITNPNSFDILNHPTTGGLYDPALGAIENQNLCETCGQAHTFCPGHMGHITLPLPVYNPFLFRLLYQLLQCACFQCHHVLAKPGQMCVFRKQMEALEHGHVSIVESMRDAYNALVVERGGDQGILEELEKMLSERIEHSQCGKSVQRDGQEEEHSSSNKKLNTKNVFALRQEMVKEFFRSKGFRGKSCPHCGAAPRQLRTEHNNKVFFATQKTVARRKQTLQQQREAELRKQAVAPEDIDALDNDSGGSDDDAGQLKSFNQTPQDYLTPMETRNHMRALWKNEANSLAVVLGALGMKMKGTRCPLDVFFLDVVPVPASRFRPLVNMRDRVFENQQTANYSRVISDSIIVRELLTEISKRQEKKDASETIETEMSSTVKNVPGSTLEEKLHNSWLHLQTKVNCVLDSDLDKLSTDKQPGIKQLLEKKEGLFRKHMMGKRVDYAARSVISPDPYINTDEIGVPLVFATKLTYPQPVTPWNFHELKQAIINGPDVHPGACYVENEHGRKIRLHAQDRNQREAIAKQLLTPSAGTTAMSPNKKVYRHLKNGDVMLLNRQPTLHRPSIQAHKVRVLPGEKTLRLHYANCKAYNADFDGDEMNAHFPQDELCRSESYHLASTHYQYLVPKDGTPLAGLIQDHMVSGVSLTMRGRHFNRGDYQQLVFAALTDKRGPVQQLPPCLLKPKRMWSGKQVLSTVLLNIIPPDKPPLNLKGKTKLSGKNWQSAKPRPLVEMLGIHGDSMGESEVVIRQGELLVGVLDKGHYGNTPYGLVHCCYELYGGAVSGRLLTSLAKLFTAFLQWKGFTLGVEDINVTSKADSKRHKLIKKGRKGGAEEAATALGLEPGVDPTTLFERLQQAHFCRDDGEMKDLDLAMKAKTDQINNDICKVLMPGGLEKKFPHNNLQLMVQSGAKGSSVNCMQISCLLGQIELEGRRPPLMMSGQFLPSFLPYNTSPRAGGFVDQRFLTGIRPQEYFFHCMAGREGLVDTAVKTSRSGYLQRCLIKHMEGLIVNYDLTVRDSDGSIVQFRYGDDGLDVMKTQFLRKQQFPFLIDNNEAVMSDDHLQSVKSKLDTTQAPKLYKKIKKWKKKTKGQTSKIKTSPFHKFVKKNSAKLLALLPEEAKEGLHEATGRSIAVEKLCEVWANMDEYHRSKYSKYLGDFPDPVLTQLQPDRYFGAVSEKFEDIVDQYFQKNPDGLLVKRHESQPGLGQMTADKFRDLLYMSSMQSLAPPGEAVGLLAAQSIGEPSTQMTLNTFHFAGRGEMNVTLGIPRLREILMVASANIRTPTMDIPLLDTRYAEDHAQYLKDKLNKIHLSQVLEEAEVRETLTVKNQRHKSRAYTIKFKFLPPDVYSSEITVAPSSILRYIEHRFLKQFSNSIRKRMEELQKCRLLSTARRRERPAPSAGADQAMQASNDDVLDDDQNEDDSVAVRNRQKQLDEQDYEGEDEEKEELGEDSESDEAYSSESETEQLGSLEQSESSLGSMQEALNVEGGSQPGSSQGKKKRKKKEKKEMDLRRVNTVLSSANSIQSYEYDATKERWCKVTYQYPLSHSKLDMATLLESEAKKAVLYQTPKISRSFLSQSKKPGEEGLMRLKTEGINIQEMFKYERILDLNKLYTNDIHATAEFYGIEAACQVLIKEVRDVFAAYGIQVDYRHLSLVADYMTFEGVYKAFNRIGLETNASPLQKMTFETTMHFLRNATTMGVCDDLKSPSARLVVGRTALSGTGSFDILQPLS